MVEVGWRLPRWAWGHGYATEAAREALAVGFDEVGLAEIVSFTAVPNERSQAVMRRLGMSPGPRRRLRLPDDPRGAPDATHGRCTGSHVPEWPVRGSPGTYSPP